MTKPRWKTPDVRRKLAVSMRRKGMSLRQIGAELNVDHKTIFNDLRHWEQQEVGNLLGNLLADPTSNSPANSPEES